MDVGKSLGVSHSRATFILSCPKAPSPIQPLQRPFRLDREQAPRGGLRPCPKQLLGLVRPGQLQRLDRPREPALIGNRLLPGGQDTPKAGPELVRLRLRQRSSEPDNGHSVPGRDQFLLRLLANGEPRAVEAARELVELRPLQRLVGGVYA